MSVLYGVPPKTAQETVRPIKHSTLSVLDDDSLLVALAELSASTSGNLKADPAAENDSAPVSGGTKLSTDSVRIDSNGDAEGTLGVAGSAANEYEVSAATEGTAISDEAVDSRSKDILADFELQVKSIEPSNIPLHLNELSLHKVSVNVPGLAHVKDSDANKGEANRTIETKAEGGDGLSGEERVHHMVIRNFTKLDDAALGYILRYRNSEPIRKNMLTTDLLTLEGHLKFCHDLKQHPNKLYLLSSFDGYPMSVASIHADESWSRLLDYGMYAVGTDHPENSAALEGRIGVYEIDRVVIAHLVLSRGIKAVDFQFKHSNAKSIYVNQTKLHTHVIRQDNECLYTRLDCNAPASVYQKQLHDFCVKYHCTLEFDF